LYETILPNEKSVCSVMLSEIGFDKIAGISTPLNNSKKKLFNIKELFSIINKHTKEYLDKEIAFFTKYSTHKTDKIIESLNAIKLQIPADNSFCILKMSAGSGFHSITGDWQYDDYSKTGMWTNGRNAGRQKYKSRKVAIHNDDSHNDVFSLMGFVKLRIMSDEDMARYEKDIADKKLAQEIKRQKEAEVGRIEREEKAKVEAERFEKEKAEQERMAKEKAMQEAAEKAEQERLANLSPDEREKEKYEKSLKSSWGGLVNNSIQIEELKIDFYKWLKQLLIFNKLWNLDVNDKKDKWVKRCQEIERKINAT
jgi:hypothetical protein